MTKLMTAEEVVQESAEDLTAQPGESAAELFDRDEIRVGLDLLEIAISESTIAAITEEHVVLLKEWIDSETDDMTEIPESLAGVLEWNESMTCLILKKQEQPAAEVSSESPAATATTNETPQSIKKWKSDIIEASDYAQKLRDELEEAESDTKAAKAREKECLESLHAAERELRRVIADEKSGQQKLPFEDHSSESKTASASDGGETETVNEIEIDASTTPISELGAKSIKKLIGTDRFNAAKDSDEPVGLTDKQLEKLEAADIATIGDLEKVMKADSWWWKTIGLANDGHAQIVQRVISTLLAFRSVNPVKS